MSNRLTFWLSGIILGVMFLLFFIDYLELPTLASSHSFLSPTDVDGSGITHHSIEYTLNFEEQNTLIDCLNRAAHVEKTDLKGLSQDLPFTGVTVYPFKGAAIRLKLVGISSDEGCIFELNDQKQTRYLKDVSNGLLLNLLKKTYD